MRIYRAAYTKPLPAGAKIKRDKEGSYVLLSDRQGQSKKCRVHGDRVTVESSTWTIVFRDHAGVERRLQGYRDRANTDLLAERVGKIVYHLERGQALPLDLEEWLDGLPDSLHSQLAGFGMVKARRAVASQDLESMLASFEQQLALKRERTGRYVEETMAKLHRMFDGCGFKRFTDIDDVRLEAFLLELRQDKTVEVDGKQVVRRGLSRRTLNSYIRAAQGFCKFCCRSLKIAKSSPLDCMEGFTSVAADQRRLRRALTESEIKTLLKKTAESEEVRYGMDGRERATLYRFALTTGFRVNEIRSLKVEHLDFDRPDGAVVYLAAGYSKHRERDVLPLHRSLVPELKQFIRERGKTPQAKLFGGAYEALTDKTARMIRADLAEAEIPFATSAGVVDFHSLRHTFVSSLKALEARTAQGLARHKSSGMTDLYSHRNLADQRAALDSVTAFGLAG